MSVPAFGMSERAVSAYPPVDLFESQTLVIARVAIPGLKTDQVFASILKGGNLLEISGETPTPTERYFQNEVCFIT
jgi:HSP20 family molecular chaperone IbpA